MPEFPHLLAEIEGCFPAEKRIEDYESALRLYVFSGKVEESAPVRDVPPGEAIQDEIVVIFGKEVRQLGYLQLHTFIDIPLPKQFTSPLDAIVRPSLLQLKVNDQLLIYPSSHSETNQGSKTRQIFGQIYAFLFLLLRRHTELG